MGLQRGVAWRLRKIFSTGTPFANFRPPLLGFENSLVHAPVCITEHALLGDLLAFNLPPSKLRSQILSRYGAALHHEVDEHFYEPASHELSVCRGESLDLYIFGLL